MRLTEKTIGRRVIETEFQKIPKLGDQLQKKRRTKKEKKRKGTEKEYLIRKIRKL